MLARLPRLERLGVAGTAIDMAALAHLPALRTFACAEPEVDLAPLRGNAQLSSLALHGATVVHEPEVLLTIPSLRYITTRASALPEPVTKALEARGVTVTTHPRAWQFKIHPDL